MPADIMFFTIGLVCFFLCFFRNTSKPNDISEEQIKPVILGGNDAETANPEYGPLKSIPLETRVTVRLIPTNDDKIDLCGLAVVQP